MKNSNIKPGYKTREQIELQNFWGSHTQPERLQTIIKYSNREDKILDLGSGRGSYTKFLTKLGNIAVGYDINYYSEWLETGKENFIIGTGSMLPFSDKSFDITIAFEVLEHIPKPDHVLKEIARCTKKYLIFSVPNCDLNNNLRKYNLAMAHWTDPNHCNFFTKSTLKVFLSENGFEMIEMTDGCHISPSDYYWDSLKIPRFVTQLPKIIINKLNLAESYWSSILVVTKVPDN
jgi:ubiquinone/menaquinone biosynthesis C-methylase UbiE